MAVSTFSTFYYGYTFTDTNNIFNFDEGSGELAAVLEIGSFTLTEALVVLKTSLDAIGVDTYTVTVDRPTRIITISSTGTFSILLGTGTQKGLSPFDLLGFTDISDTAFAADQKGTTFSGFKYDPQFLLQDYTSDDDFQERIDSSVNESASGEIEVVNFGIRKLIELSIKFVTDQKADCVVILNNPNGVSSCRSFLIDITTKNPIEFMLDKTDTSSFKKLVLQSTKTSREGTSFKLLELAKSGGPRDYYEINNLKFRVF